MLVDISFQYWNNWWRLQNSNNQKGYYWFI